jgi:CD109 antigen
MEMLLVAIVAVIGLGIADSSNNNGTYMISAPSDIRPGYPYKFYATVFDADNGDSTVYITAQLLLKDGYVYRDEDRKPDQVLQEVTHVAISVNPDERHAFTMEIPADMERPTWSRQIVLIVNGTGAVDFHNMSSALTFQDKRISIFIQTDKPIYKPGQTVLFRTFAIYPTLLPISTQTAEGRLKVTITDPQKNTILSETSDDKNSDLSVTEDLVSGKFELTSPTVQGTWTITVEKGPSKESITFNVEEYVLPKFEVTVEKPPYLLKFDDLTGVISAIYTYGKPLPSASITLQIHEQAGWICKLPGVVTPSWYNYQPVCNIFERKAKMVDGMYDFRITNKDLLAMLSKKRCSYDGKDEKCVNEQKSLAGVTWVVTANITDHATEKMISERVEIRSNWQNVQLQWTPLSPKSYKAGLDYVGLLKIAKLDDSPPDKMMRIFSNGSERVIAVKTTFNCPPEYNYYPMPMEPVRGPIGVNGQEPGIPGPAPTPSPEPTKDPMDPVCSAAFMEDEYPVPTEGLLYVPVLIENFKEKYPGFDPTIYDSMSIEATYFDPWNQPITAYHSVDAFKTLHMKAMQVSILLEGGSVMPDTEAAFTIKANHKIDKVTCELWSKGSTKFTKTWQFGTPSMDLDIPIGVDMALARSLAPKARIVCWYITDGELIADSVDFTVSTHNLNQVDISFSINETQPGNTVNLNIKAYPRSQVALLAVDQKVLLINKEEEGNDITPERLDRDLSLYDTYGNYYPMPYFGGGMIDKRRKRSVFLPCRNSFYCWPFFSRATSVKELFQQVGMIVMTNLYVHDKPRRDIYPMFRGGVAGAQGPVAESAPMAPAGSADTSANSGGTLQDVKRTRKEFPETWIWTTEAVGDNGDLTISDIKVPDSITSWVATGYALSREAGLGIAPAPIKLGVFKPFFIEMALPYSVVRGEEFLLEVTVYNYQDTDQTAVVTLEKSAEFNVLFKKVKLSMEVKFSLLVKAGGTGQASFWIIPLKAGNIAIRAKGQTTMAADGLMRLLLVKSEGIQEEYCDSVFANLPTVNNEPWIKKMKVDLPSRGLVQGSELYWISAIGDIMGNTVNNLDHLVRMPTGCGEQNMVGLVPNIYVMQYLMETQQDNQELATKAIEYMKAGYQRELTYKRVDNSFSGFGSRDESGSTWLTTFVIKSFTQAQPFIPNTVDMYLIKISAEWILGQQNKNGSFNEPGSVHNRNLQGGAAEGVPLTAFVVLALLDIKTHPHFESYPVDFKTNYNTALEKAIAFLESKLTSISDQYYALSITSYALVKAQSLHKETTLVLIEPLVIRENGLMYLADEKEDLGEDVSPWMWWRRTRTYNIEATAYYILALVADPNTPTTDALPGIKYLSSKTNRYGGFTSTQDTVLGLKALTAFASDTYSTSGSQALQVDVLVNNDNFPLDMITRENAFVLQKVQIDDEKYTANLKDVTITASGTGVALVQFCASYHVTEVDESESLMITVVSNSTNANIVTLTICWRWTNDQKGSGMGMIEVDPLSGYNIDTGDLVSMYGEDGLKRIDQTTNSIAFYWQEFKTEQQCMTITQYRSSNVGNIQNAQVKIYTYYSPEIAKIVFYNAPIQVDVCVLCPSCCDGEVEGITPKPPIIGGTSTNVAGLLITVITFLWTMVLSQ